jgi:hypothetical protein
VDQALNLGDMIVDRYGLVTRQADPHSPLELGLCVDGYESGGDGVYSRDEFIDRMFQCVTLCFYLTRIDTRDVEVIFGVELCADHTNFLFCSAAVQAPRGVMKRCAPAIVDICEDLTRRWCRWQWETEAKMLLRGRPGWARILKSLGIERDEDGWISEDQERFR